MKTYRTILLSAVALTAALSSCRDEIDVPSPAQNGDAIRFSVQLPDIEKTRTYYGSELEDISSTQWPIYWNIGDKIFVWAPDGLAGKNESYYTITSQSENETGSKDISLAVVAHDGENGVQWGDGSTSIYAFYPGDSNIITKQDNSTITATLPGNQSPDLSKFQPVDATADPTTYYISPDMKNCFMVAKNKDVEPTTETVTLEFQPYCSVLNIILNGPSQETGNFDGGDQINVTSVTISSEQQIVGDFSIDMENLDLTENETLGTFTTEATTPSGAPKNQLGDWDRNMTRADATTATDKNPIDEALRTIFISTMYDSDTDGVVVKRGIPLRKVGDKLQLQAFILPNPDIKDITVRVRTADGKLWTKTLTLTEESGTTTTNYWKPRQIHTCQLPYFNKNYTFDFSIWLSQLDPNIYISELSMPGSALSFNYPGSTSTNVTDLPMSTQLGGANGNIEAQFNAGIRVFQAHCGYDGSSLETLSDGVTTIPMINLKDSRGHNLIDTEGGGGDLTLYKLLSRMQKQMIQSHADEFCVLCLSDYGGDLNVLYTAIKEATDYLADPKTGTGNMIPESAITPNTTIGDVKDKIIVKYQINANENSSDLTSAAKQVDIWSNLQDADAMFNLWTDLAGSMVLYSPLYSGANSSFKFGSVAVTGSGTSGYNITGSGLCLDFINQLQYFKNIGDPNINKVQFRDLTEANFSSSNPPSMYFIYAEQANPGAENTTNYSNSFANITNMAGKGGAILSSYDKTKHDKYYMTYLGGAGALEGSTAVTINFGTDWLTNCLPALYEYESLNIDGTVKEGATTFNYIPFGWVMVNNVNLTYVNNPNLGDDTDPYDVTARVIQKVIMNNGHQKLLLQRKTGVSSSVNNSVAGSVTSGGNLFNKPGKKKSAK